MGQACHPAPQLQSCPGQKREGPGRWGRDPSSWPGTHSGTCPHCQGPATTGTCHHSQAPSCLHGQGPVPVHRVLSVPTAGLHRSTAGQPQPRAEGPIPAASARPHGSHAVPSVPVLRVLPGLTAPAPQPPPAGRPRPRRFRFARGPRPRRRAAAEPRGGPGRPRRARRGRHEAGPGRAGALGLGSGAGRAGGAGGGRPPPGAGPGQGRCPPREEPSRCPGPGPAASPFRGSARLCPGPARLFRA